MHLITPMPYLCLPKLRNHSPLRLQGEGGSRPVYCHAFPSHLLVASPPGLLPALLTPSTQAHAQQVVTAPACSRDRRGCQCSRAYVCVCVCMCVAVGVAVWGTPQHGLDWASVVRSVTVGVFVCGTLLLGAGVLCMSPACDQVCLAQGRNDHECGQMWSSGVCTALHVGVSACLRVVEEHILAWWPLISCLPPCSTPMLCAWVRGAGLGPARTEPAALLLCTSSAHE